MSYSADVEKTTPVLHGNENNHIYICMSIIFFYLLKIDIRL